MRTGDIGIARVFPRRMAYTPIDDLAFVGDPPLMLPDVNEVHVSVCFTWDVREAHRLRAAWAEHYPKVDIGGPAMDSAALGVFVPNMYVKHGVTFTSRGCDKICPWCLVPSREGRLRPVPGAIPPGYIIQDNNFLQMPPYHRRSVYAMLEYQPKAARFAGGLDASLIDDEIAAELRGIRIDEVFLAADTEAAMPTVLRARERLHWLSRRQVRCYVLLGWGADTVDAAEARLQAVWDGGMLPFAQLYQSPSAWVRYGADWRALARTWSRPAAMYAEAHAREKASDMTENG